MVHGGAHDRGETLMLHAERRPTASSSITVQADQGCGALGDRFADGVGFVGAPRTGPQEVPGRLSRHLLGAHQSSWVSGTRRSTPASMADLAIRRPGTS